MLNRPVVKNLFCMFGAIGAGAEGFSLARATVGGHDGRWQIIGSMDIDHRANKVFERKLGVRATTRDLMDREQYLAFHDGREPPPGWAEATPADVRAAAGHARPNAVFLSAPCKGFSGLLSETKSLTGKYQALNRLTLRGVWLMLEAWADDPPELILFENVPRLATRGRVLLDRITAMLRAYGYVTAETTHDCGELAGLAQHRKRFLLVARRLDRVPNFLYEPPQRAMRAVGDVLGRMPLAGDPRGGVMHRLPALQWRTWVRLAFVEAGSDWRSLNRLEVEDGHLRDYLLVPEMHRGGYGVRRWDDPSGTVQSESRPSNGAFSVADPLVRPSATWNAGQQYGVLGWGDKSGAIAAQQCPNQGRYAVADVRVPDNEFHGWRVVRWADAAGTVTGARCSPGGSAQSVADVRCSGVRHNNAYRLTDWEQASGTVTGGMHASGGGGVADPRPDWNRRGNNLVVQAWGDSSRTIIAGGKGVQGGYLSIADPRTGLAPDRGAYLTGGHYGVLPWTASSGAVSASACHDNGAWSVADVRGALPAIDEQLVTTIIAEDGTFHRPFTTLELAALQSLFDPEDPADVRAFTDAFTAETPGDTMCREWIGNAVPREAAMRIGEEMLRTLMLADAGETFALSETPIWVRPVIAALSLPGAATA